MTNTLKSNYREMNICTEKVSIEEIPYKMQEPHLLFPQNVHYVSAVICGNENFPCTAGQNVKYVVHAQVGGVLCWPPDLGWMLLEQR